MSLNFTGTFILDDSQPQSTIARTSKQLAVQDAVITNNQHRLSTYFSWAMHMANVWGNYISHTLEGTKYAAEFTAVTQGLNIMSAELSIALTMKRAMSDLANPATAAAGYFQLALAASMQFVLIDMQRMRAQAEAQARRFDAIHAAWRSYRQG